MIKLIITDLDGTFLTSKSDFDQQEYQRIQALMHDKDIIFAACTGKQCERVDNYLGLKRQKTFGF